MNPFIYLRALKHAEHTVFCVEDGQKTYYDPQFSRRVPYSSGQQVKRSILQSVTDILNVPLIITLLKTMSWKIRSHGLLAILFM